MKKFARFYSDGNTFWALVEGSNGYKVINSIYNQSLKIDQQPININELKILAPFEGNKVIGLGYNYKGLVGERSHYDEPLIFLKSPDSVISHKADVIYPEYCNKIWIETELTIVIGKRGKNISLDQANDYILGYTCGNDITAENIYDRDWHLAISKGLDTFAPIGPYLVQDIDTRDLKILSTINGRVTQQSMTGDRILNDQECIALVSKYFTLNPGDVIMTGTPAGARDAVVYPGDEVTLSGEVVDTHTDHALVSLKIRGEKKDEDGAQSVVRGNVLCKILS